MGWLGVRPAMRTVACGPMYHSAPNVFTLLAGHTGGLMVFQSKFEPEALLGFVERSAIDSPHLVPTMMIRLLPLPDEVRNRYDLSSLTPVTHAAAPCPPQIERACIDLLGSIVNEYYGGTETGPAVACDSTPWLAQPGTVGQPIGGAELRVLDDEGRRLGPGGIGEIYIRNRAIGDFTYHNHDDKRRNIKRDGFITVGDVGYFDDDGLLYICDRSADMIISGGVNIYPAETEAELHLHPMSPTARCSASPTPSTANRSPPSSNSGAALPPTPTPSKAGCMTGWPASRFRGRSSSPPNCPAKTAAESSNANCTNSTGRDPYRDRRRDSHRHAQPATPAQRTDVGDPAPTARHDQRGRGRR